MLTSYQEASKVERGNLSISQLGETEHVTGVVLEPKGEHIHVITLGTSFIIHKPREVEIYTKKGCCRLEHSQELCLDRGTNISNSDLQIC